MANLNPDGTPPFPYRMAQRGALTRTAALASADVLSERELAVAVDTGSVWIGDGVKTMAQLTEYRLGGGTGGGGGTGPAGVGIKTLTVNGSGHLIVTLTDDSTQDAGLVKGADGAKGDKGDTGAASTVAGPKGDPGAAGSNGTNGTNGTTPNIQVGTTTTGAAGSSAAVTRRDGSPDSAPVLDFTIPQGAKGADGTGGSSTDTATGGRIGPDVSVLATGSDLNAAVTSGWYGVSSPTNAPLTAATYYFLQVIINATGSTGWQRLFNPASGRSWTRARVASSFSAWVEQVNPAVKKAAYRMGGTHSTSNMGGTQTQIRQRTPGLQLPVQADRWRIHFRNYNSLTSSNAGSNPVTVLNAYIGKTAAPSSSSEYTCTAALQQMPGASTSVQGTTEWVSDWCTPASVGITDTRQRFNLQFDLNWTAGDYIGTTSSMFCAMIDTTTDGSTVQARTVADFGAPGGSASATAWYSYNYMVGEAWIEYEYADATVPSVLMLGHSYVDAAQFSGTAGQLGQPSGFAQKFARRHKSAVTVNAYSTSKMTDWVNGATISDKFNILTTGQGYSFDSIVVMLGGNDIVNDTSNPTAATLLTRFQAVVNAIVTRYPGVPIYAATNTPFGATNDTANGSGGKTVTAAMLTAQDGFNAGLTSTIRGLAGVLDFETVMRDPANTRRPLAAYLGSDNIHPNPRGYDRLADAITLG